MEDPVEDYSVNGIVKAVQYGKSEIVEKALLEKNISPDACDESGCSLLHWAAINNRSTIVKFLISKGANVNIVGGTLKEIPLQWAIRNGRYCQLVQFLIEAGSDLHHKNVHGADALQVAVRCGNLNMVFQLLVAGASPNTSTAQGDTPLLYLIKEKLTPESVDLIRLLLNFHADVHQRDHGM
jgi:palmitoyltransferase